MVGGGCGEGCWVGVNTLRVLMVRRIAACVGFLFRPFRACFLGWVVSQGFALGCIVFAPLGLIRRQFCCGHVVRFSVEFLGVWGYNWGCGAACLVLRLRHKIDD